MGWLKTNMTTASIILSLAILLANKIVGGNESVDDQHIRHLEARTSNYDASSLKCQIGKKGPDKVKLANVDFEFWYAIGLSEELDAMKFFQIEQLLYTNVEDDMVWCWEEMPEIEESGTGTRNLVKKQATRRKRLKDARRMGIVTFTPGHQDREAVHACPDQLLEDFGEATEATECVVVVGSMRIIAHERDDLSYAIAGLRDGLEAAMANGLGQNDELPYLKYLSYLGDNEEEVMSLLAGGSDSNGGGIIGGGIIGGGSDSNGGGIIGGGIIGGGGDGGDGDGVDGDGADGVDGDGADGADGDGADGVNGDGANGDGGIIGGGIIWDGNGDDGSDGRGEFNEEVQNDEGNSTELDQESDGRIDRGPAFGIIESTHTGDDDDKDVGVAWAVGSTAVIILLLALLLRKKRTVVNAATYYDLQDRDYVLPGTGDPPGSFHEGLFHYMREGQCYLSTNCELCYETRRDLQYIEEIHGIDPQLTSDRDLGTIMENEPYESSYSASYEEILIRADSHKGLGQQHMGIDVHKCSSSTCKRCTPRLNQQPMFLSPKDKTSSTLYPNMEQCAEV